MEEFVTQLCIISIFLGLFTIGLCLFRPRLKSYFKAETRLGLELLVLLRALIVFPFFVRFFTALPKMKSSVQIIARQTESIAYTVAANFHSQPLHFDPWQCLFLVWGTVAGIVFIMCLICDLPFDIHIRFTGKKLSAFPDRERCEKLQQIIASVAEEMKVSDRLVVRTSKFLDSPGILVGPRKFTLYLSKNILEDPRFGEDEFRIILRHEFFHYLHHDQWKNLLIRLVLAVHWFNPFAYYFAYLVYAEIEQARDYEALEGQDKRMRKILKKALVDIADSSMLKENQNVGMNFFSSKRAKRALMDRFRNIDDKRQSDYNHQVLPIFGIVIVVSLVINFNGIFQLELMSPDVPINEAQVSQIVSQGKIPFSLPIQNPRSVSVPDWFKRYPNLTVNKLIIAANIGTDVCSPINGKITFAGYNRDANNGYYIVIENEQLIVTIEHLTQVNLKVSDNIAQNDPIGKVSRSGKTIETNCEVTVTDKNQRPVDLSSFVSR